MFTQHDSHKILLQATVLFLLGTTVAAAPGKSKPEVPMAVDFNRTATTRWLNKPVLTSRLLDDMEDPSTWTLHNRGQLFFTQERFRDGRQSVRITAVGSENLAAVQFPDQPEWIAGPWSWGPMTGGL